ncbi:GntR family transcriptional regulator [Bacillus fonticola]|uniref:GntR family transcriptional regulator n=1 Tax=Bacillus fonticola TaxID=2728853 RepID=UPI0014762F62|nr:GntR family transcriptional regulator [Bacillus fonticola]
MSTRFQDNRPIFQQIAERIADAIVDGSIQEGERVPSTNEFATHFQINPATAAKGVNKLVEEGILYKKRGIGMFVQEGARQQLLEERKQQFYLRFVVPMQNEAKRLHLSKQDIFDMVEKGEEKND